MPGIRTSMNTTSNLVLTEHPQRLGGAACQDDVLDVRRGLEQPPEILERRALVIDHEHARHAARTPALNFGSVIVTVVPCSGSLAISSP